MNGPTPQRRTPPSTRTAPPPPPPRPPARTTPVECATSHPRGAALLPPGNRPRLRRHAVPLIAGGARPPLGHAHLRRSLVAGRVQCPLPAQPGEGADRAVGGLRPPDADRLRPRRRARGR